MTETDLLLLSQFDTWTSTVLIKRGAGRTSNERVSLYGLEKLRSLIIDLAVSGHLVPQDPRDEPAQELLRRSRSVAARRSDPIEAPMLRDDELGKLPPGWCWARFVDISKINPRNDAADETLASFVPMPLVSTRIDGAHETESRYWGDIKAGFTHFANGDLALAKITPCFENGKAAVFENLENGIGSGTTELHVARPYLPELDRHYLLLVLKTSKFLLNGERNMTGTAGQKRLPRSYFELTPFPLPPAPEQKRIVAKVNELMRLCDALLVQASAARRAGELLSQRLLSDLVNSSSYDELADHWRLLDEHWNELLTTPNTVHELKRAILELAARGLITRPQPTDGRPSIQENSSPPTTPFSIPPTWRWARLSSLGFFRGGGTPSKSRAEYWGGDIPWVSPKDMKRTVIDGAQLHITDQAIDGSAAKLIPPRSILFVVRGMILAHSFPVAINAVPVTINQDMKALVLHDPEMAEYVSLALQGMRRQMLPLVRRSSHDTRRLDADDYSEFWVPIPSQPERARIVERVTKLYRLCDKLLGTLRDNADRGVALTDALHLEATA